MKKNIELAIDLAAVTMICEMWPAIIDNQQVSEIKDSILEIYEELYKEQPSAEMLLKALHSKYCNN